MDFAKWQKNTPLLGEKGCLVASDITQEWLLPWWWENYKKHNDYPIAFVDLGLSPRMKEWCKQRGHYHLLTVSDHFVRAPEDFTKQDLIPWENYYGNVVISLAFTSRGAWFKKPFACLNTPFETTLWLDSDCQVMGSLDPLFDTPIPKAGLRVALESYKEKSDQFINSGVIVFTRGSPLIEAWALESIANNHIHLGDQDSLYAVLKEQHLHVADIPFEYNWSRFLPNNPNTKVMHWHGPQGKAVIEHQIRRKNFEPSP